MVQPLESAAAESPAPALPAAEGAGLLQVLLILRRRWRLLALVWAAAVGATAVWTFTSPRLYRPQATLEIRPETPVLSGSESSDPAMLASRLMWENYYRTQEQILTSPSLVQAVLKTLPDVDREYREKEDPIREFVKRLDIEKVRTSFILKVGFVDEDGAKAARIVNTLVSLYLEDANRRLRELKTGAMEALSKEALPSLRSKVEEADRALREFQEGAGFIDFQEHYKSLVETWRKVDARRADLRLRRAQLRAERDALASYGADGVSGLFNPAFHATRSLEPLIQQRAKVSAELGKARKLYKDRHPAILELEEELRSIEAKVRESIEGTLQALETDLRKAELEERALEEERGAVEREMAQAGRRLTEFRRLETELASAKEVYNAYLKKQGETTATSRAGLASVWVVDAASVPKAPYKPNVPMNLALGGLVGLMLGVAAVFVTEHVDDRIQSPREVEGFLGLEVLAVVPRLSGGQAAGEGPVLLDEAAPLPELEAFRTLRSELVTRLEGLSGGRVVAVLSPNAGEGKSTVAANLARVLAMEGRRVLVLDADLRRPSQRRLIGGSEGPGLEEVLRGGAAFEEAAQASRLAGVDVLGAREGTRGAAELAGAAAFEGVLKAARGRYDWVLVDSAPVNEVSEAALVARRADGVVLVVRQGRTGRGAAQAARKRLAGMGVPVLGGVLNGASGAPGYGYYYSAYGSYSR
jgi:capsular exopolysaccharide synthesis family protein